MMGRSFWLGWLAVLLLVGMGCRSNDDTPQQTPIDEQTTITITAPDNLLAGESLTVALSLEQAVDGEGWLNLTGTYGARLFGAVFVDGAALVEISAENTQKSGLVTLEAGLGASRGSAEMNILPREVVEPLIPLVGARSIIADGESWAMTVVVPNDVYDNPLVNGTPVTMRALHPQNNLEILETETTHLLAWQRIFSGVVAGKTTIAVEIDGRFGPDNDLLEIAGWPETFAVIAEYGQLIADGRQLVTLKTDVLADQFGNILPDGTLVHFIISSDDGERSLPALTIDGSAETTMQAPDFAQTMQIEATVFGVKSSPMPLTFVPTMPTFSVSTLVLDDQVLVEAGPVLSSLNQFMPDGTAVTLRLFGVDGEEIGRFQSEVESGYVRLPIRQMLPENQPLTLVVTIGAQQVEHEFEVTAP